MDILNTTVAEVQGATRKLATQPVKPGAKEIVSRHSGLTGLDEEGLAKELAGLRSDPKLVGSVLDRLAECDRDDVGTEFAERLSDAQLAELAKTGQGKALLQRVIGDLNSGQVFDDEASQVQRLGTAVSTRYRRVLDDNLPAGVARTMAVNGLEHQPIGDGNGKINFDEHAVTIERMPAGVSPEQFLQQLANNPNGALKSDGFNRWVEFERRGSSPQAAPGAIYDLDILGPDDATVVMKDQSKSHFTLTTVGGDPHGEHPVYGNREFGFRRNQDGSVTFYTLAADRMDLTNGKTPAGGLGRAAQAQTWNAWTQGVADAISRQGGKVRPGSRTESFSLR